MEKPTEEWRAIRILHFSLITGVSMFLVLSLYLLAGGYRFSFPPQPIELIIVNIIMLLGAPLIGNYVLKRTLQKLRGSHESEVEQLNIYRSGKIVQWALLEGTALLGIASFFLTDYVSFLFITVVALSLLIMARPVKSDLPYNQA